MNVVPVKSLAYAASMALLGGIGYLGYDYYENERHATYFDLERAEALLNGVQPVEPPPSAGLDFEGDVRPAVVTFDWTGAPPEERAAIDPEEPEEVDEPVVPVDEILDVLLALVDGDDPDESLCLLRFADETLEKRELWYGVGSMLPAPNDHVSVYRILEEGVEFSFADDDRPRELVAPSELSTSGIYIVSVADPSEIRTPPKKDLVFAAAEATPTAPVNTEIRHGQYYVGTEDADIFARDYADILANDVTTRTYYEDGKRAGVELTEVRPGSIAARHGGQSGDVVISINGHPVTSEHEAIQYAKQNPGVQVWEIEVLRLGRVETIVYHSPGD